MIDNEVFCGLSLFHIVDFLDCDIRIIKGLLMFRVRGLGFVKENAMIPPHFVRRLGGWMEGHWRCTGHRTSCAVPIPPIKATIQQHAGLCIHNNTAETHHFLCNQGFTHSCLFWQPYINCFDSSSAQLNFSTIQLFFSHLLMSLCCSSHNKHTRIFII